MNEKEKKEFNKRQKNQLSKENREKSALESLQKRLLDVRNGKNGNNFLNITSRWSSTERAKFETGVNQYRGEARKLYCDATGLTNDYLETATQEMLLLAAVNVGMLETLDGNMGTGELRKKLRMFVMFGMMPKASAF